MYKPVQQCEGKFEFNLSIRSRSSDEACLHVFLDLTVHSSADGQSDFRYELALLDKDGQYCHTKGSFHNGLVLNFLIETKLNNFFLKMELEGLMNQDGVAGLNSFRTICCRNFCLTIK